MTSTDTLIIGAGPYGLSIAAHLRQAGIPFEIVGNPMESWRTFMPVGMVLRSEPFASNLWDPERRFTYERFMATRGLAYQAVARPIPNEQFLEYADWFRSQAVGDIRQTKVRSLKRDGHGFHADMMEGEPITAKRVVLATGYMAYRRTPAEFAGLSEPLCIHSARMHEIADYAGKKTAVVGSGQSALETAALLHEVGAQVTMVARKAALKWNPPPASHPSLIERITAPEAGLGAGWRSLAVSEFPFLFRTLFAAEKRHRFVATSWGPSGAWWLRERCEGRINALMGRTLHAAHEDGGGVALELNSAAGRETLKLDRIVSATGFELNLARVDYIASELRAQIALEGERMPLLSSQFETSVPGLYVVGVTSAPTFGPVMRFMFGAKHAAPRVAHALAATRTRTTAAVAPQAAAAN